MLLIGFLAIFAVFQSVLSSDPVVTISKHGKVRGIYMEGYRNGKFEAFMGIPYAKPPVGDLRFANPVPIDPLVGTLHANAAKADCIQKNYLLPTPVVSGVEDCLYLNVYRPIGVSQNRTVPVMVYIYGGGFFSGSANPVITGPEFFMDTKKVIVVTLAYRLGAFGFLSTGDDSSPGNFALKDQTTALRWVQKHIHKFGGRKDSVTIFGQSAGGVSVHMHMLSPLSENLFQRAIVISGNAGAPYNEPIKDPLAQARRQAEFVGIQNSRQLSTKDLITALRKINALDLVLSGDKFKYWHVDPLTTFRTVVESNNSGAFITKNPRDLIKSGNYRHVPWMTSFVPFEGAVRALSIMSNDTLLNQFNANFDELLIRLMEIPTETIDERTRIIDLLVNRYLNGSHQLTEQNAQGLGNMISGRAFIQPLFNTIQNYVQYANTKENPVYIYKFAYRGQSSYSVLFSGNTNDYGVVHCDDLIYLLRSPVLFSDPQRDSTEAKVSAAMIENFVTFAIEGHPKQWEPIESCSNDVFKRNDKMFCDIQEFKNSLTPGGYQISVTNDFDTDEVQFWDDLLG